ncbi:hypothetical protein K7432_007404 [Basidiobolus ranarum]|uniref:Metallo-beta-lactamase domain-containing protein n=1 Tax=Basidiobolus ranarum TaxID=34480 RepID=A0ABR2WTN9_9FUNG
MKLLITALPALALLVSCAQAHNARLKIYHHSASESAMFSVSSLIVGNKEAMVVDAPFTNSAALSLIEFIKNTTNVPVTKIFATHEHPDHYFGGTELLRAFPHASMFATPSVVKRIQKTVQSKVGEWRPVYGPTEIPEHPDIPKPFTSGTIKLRGNEKEFIHLLKPLQGDVDDIAVVWIPSQKTLITGDLVYSKNQHVWLAESRDKKSRKNWIASLNYIQSLKPRRVIGGHVPIGAKPMVSDIQGTKDYIEYFNRNIFDKGYTAQQISDKISRKYPNRQAPIMLNVTAQTYGQEKRQ